MLMPLKVNVWCDVYKTLYLLQKITCAASGKAVPLRAIGRDEYAALRKAHLPAGSVVQEGCTLDFLQTQAQFYAGDGFVLAATPGENELFIPEFLGDTTLLPGILQSLNAKKGAARTPGSTPFAMYLPLKNFPPPTYFGLALD